MVTSYVCQDSLSEVSHDLYYLGKEGTSIEATRASFRWVLDNSERRPLEETHRDPRLLRLWTVVARLFEDHKKMETAPTAP